MPNLIAPVSVVIPCYCCADSIIRTVESVVSQTLLPKELFLIDDASPDDGATLEMLQKLKKKYDNFMKIEVISLRKNSGPGAVRNVGWEISTQLYIAFLDADDSWHPEKLYIQYEWMRQHPDVVLSGHAYDIIGESFTSKDLPDEWQYFFIRKLDVMLRNPFSTPTVMLKRTLPFRFENGQFYAEDFFLWQQIICAGYRVAKIELTLAYLYKAPYGDSGLSSHLWAMEKAEISNYYKLYKRKYIDIATTSLLTLFSFLKFSRRLLVVKIDRIVRRT